MKETDIKICLKKINKDQKIIVMQKNQHKSFCLFFFTSYKNGTKGFDF